MKNRPVFPNDKMATLRAMNLYWDEVSKRDSVPPGYAHNELGNVIRTIGAGGLLNIVRHYVETEPSA